MFSAEMKAGLTADKLAAGLVPAMKQMGVERRRLEPAGTGGRRAARL